MDGFDGKLAMCPDVAEKQHKKHRLRGCGGIFCLLFDWNTARISAKKRLLTSGSGRDIGMHFSSKRFGAQPTTNFHQNGNRSFREKCRMDLLVNTNQQMKAPTLVAKLMGLDCIPATVLDAKKHPKLKYSHSQPGPSGCHKDGGILMEAHLKNKPQLQKQRKTRRFDIQLSMARCGRADSVELRNGLLCSTRDHRRCTKLSMPVKCSRVCSVVNNAARLPDAAKKILEPESKVTKCKAISTTKYSHFVPHDSNQELTRRINYNARSPCKSCALLNGEELGFQQAKAEHGASHPTFLVNQKQKSSPACNEHLKQKHHFESLAASRRQKINKLSFGRKVPKKVENVKFGKSSFIRINNEFGSQVNGEVCSGPLPESLALSVTQNSLPEDKIEGAAERLVTMEEIPDRSHLRHKAPANNYSNLGLTESISYILDKMQHHGASSLKKLSHFKEVILRVAPLLESGRLNRSTDEKEYVICHFFDRMEIIANTICTDSLALPGFMQLQSINQLMWILFDLAVEYLESCFGNIYELKLELQKGVSLDFTIQQLILGLNYEIFKWANLRGHTANKIVEMEVSHSSEILYDYDIEARKVCFELGEYLLKGLVEEIVMEASDINLVQNCSES